MSNADSVRNLCRRFYSSWFQTKAGKVVQMEFEIISLFEGYFLMTVPTNVVFLKNVDFCVYPLQVLHCHWPMDFFLSTNDLTRFFYSFFQAIHFRPRKIIILYSRAVICQHQRCEKIAMLTRTAKFVSILMFQISFLLEAHLVCFWHTGKCRWKMTFQYTLAFLP